MPTPFPLAAAAAAALLLALFGCTHESEHASRHDEAGHEPADATDHQQTDHDGHAGVDLELALDDGKKWQVDDHTRRSAAAMIERVHGTPPFTTVDDARAMHAALDAELKQLIAGCTMEGAAHDQLHVVLAALFPRLNALKSETDVETLDATRIEIASILDAYRRHFA